MRERRSFNNPLLFTDKRTKTLRTVVVSAICVIRTGGSVCRLSTVCATRFDIQNVFVGVVYFSELTAIIFLNSINQYVCNGISLRKGLNF